MSELAGYQGADCGCETCCGEILIPGPPGFKGDPAGSGLYLGAFPTAPTSATDGGPLVKGHIYWNTTSGRMFVWNGQYWEDLTHPAATINGQYTYQFPTEQTAPYKLPATDIYGKTMPTLVQNMHLPMVFMNGVKLLVEVDPAILSADYRPVWGEPHVEMLHPVPKGAVIEVWLVYMEGSLRANSAFSAGFSTGFS